MNNNLTRILAIAAIGMLAIVICLLIQIRMDLNSVLFNKDKLQNARPDSTLMSLDWTTDIPTSTLFLPRRDWMAFDNFAYYPIRDGNLSDIKAKEIIKLINSDEKKARDILRSQVSNDEIKKYDTLKTDIILKLDTDFLNVRVWINGFDTRIIDKKIELKNLPIRPETIHLVIMVQDPDEAKLEGSIKINNKEVKFEFKEMKAIDLVVKDFKLSEFAIQECKYIPPCPSNPV